MEIYFGMKEVAPGRYLPLTFRFHVTEGVAPSAYIMKAEDFF